MKQIGNGIRLYLMIPCDEVMLFMRGEMVRAWPTSPAAHCPGTENQKDKESYFPKGSTKIRVDPDKVIIGEYLSGVFTIQRKFSDRTTAPKTRLGRAYHTASADGAGTKAGIRQAKESPLD